MAMPCRPFIPQRTVMLELEDTRTNSIRRKITIHDVAQAAGVSIGTASKALNRRGHLRDETRRRVLDAAERLGFQSNDLVHSLLRGRSYTVGLLTTDLYGRFSMPLLTGIEDALSAARLSVFLCTSRDDPERERQHVRTLLAKQVDGIIIAGRRIDPRPPVDFGAAHVPHLYAFAQVEDPAALCLLPDDAQGGRCAVEHLIRTGRRHLAHITGPQTFVAARIRAQAALAVAAEYGIDLPDERVFYGCWDEDWGYAAANHLLDRDAQLDGISCGNDLIARGVADALRERRVRIPEDVALEGFDNWEIIATKTRPPLSTIDLNLHELGRRAGERLLAMIAGEHLAGIERQPCTLVVRQSSGAGVPAAMS
jgi:LacI family transcriptional regulator